MHRLKPDVDIIGNLLETVLEARPDSTFIQSLLFQYRERGGLSKKQLEGLYHKATRINTIPTHKLSTLEAIIKRKPTRFRSALPQAAPLYKKDGDTGHMLEALLAKYPQHKRILFLKAKYDNNETLSVTESEELKKFYKMLH